MKNSPPGSLQSTVASVARGTTVSTAVVCLFLLVMGAVLINHGSEPGSIVAVHHRGNHASRPSATLNDEAVKQKANTISTYVFQDIYNHKIWGEDGNGSGPGSSISYTKRTRLIVELLVTRYKVTKLLDAPCGAMKWMSFVIDRLHQLIPNFRYCGVDVVPTVIDANKERFKLQDYYDFQVVDVTQQALPKGFDMIWCRDALQHLSYDLIVPALENFANSGAKYLAVGSYKLYNNFNITTGEYFSIDLREAPFGLTEVLDVFDEETEDGKLVLVYTVEYLKKQDYKEMRKRAGIPTV